MSDNGFIPLSNNADFIANLIFSLKEGTGIWFSWDNRTGHEGEWTWIECVQRGDEITYQMQVKGQHGKSDIGDDADVKQVANELADGRFKYYTIQEVEGYVKRPYDHYRDDDQSVGDYEKFGPDQMQHQYENKQPMKIKKTLLESLIKVCTKELLQQINEAKKSKEVKLTEKKGWIQNAVNLDHKGDCTPMTKSTCTPAKKALAKRFKSGDIHADNISEEAPETVGATAPPVDGQGGTGDSPAIPKPEVDDTPPAPSQPETPKTDVNLKGIVLVNPNDKSSLKSIPFSAMADDAAIERTLHRVGSTIAGAKIKIALSTLRAVRDGLKNKETPTYIYIGKYDPTSEELFVMADRSLDAAKEFSISPEEIQGAEGQLNPDKSVNGDYDDYEFTKKLAGKTGTNDADKYADDGFEFSPEKSRDPADISENVKLKKLVNRIVKESIK